MASGADPPARRERATVTPEPDRQPPDRPSPDVDVRIELLVRRADLEAVAAILAREQDAVFGRWLAVARRQPFHAEHPERAVTDHIPALIAAITDVLRAGAERDDDVEAPLQDPGVIAAAQAHAHARFEMGLGPVAIATEFRLLRQEMSRSLRTHLDDDLPAGDVVSAIMVVNDALDGATALALSALTKRVETVREDFLAMALHDIRQPLTVVDGSLELAARWLQQDPVPLGQVREAVGGALSATMELVLFVDTLADASRVALGALELEPEPTRIRDIVSESVAAVAPEQRTRIRVDLGSNAGAVGTWDHRAIRRVLANLLSNALKYSPPGSPIEVSADTDGPRVRLMVRDHGVGIERDELDGLFGRYARADTARASGQAGLGLGLYVCHGLVTAHGGRIWLESDGRDAGATAMIELPLDPPEPG
jgi:signal transduction histidine kinase